MPQYLVAIRHPDTFDLFQVSPGIDVLRLCQHGRSRCVGKEASMSYTGRDPCLPRIAVRERQEIFATL